MVFHLIHGPDGSFDVLHTHEALVQAQIMTDGVLEQAIRDFTYTYNGTRGVGWGARALSEQQQQQKKSVLLLNA